MKIEVHRHPGTPQHIDAVEVEATKWADDDPRPTVIEVRPEPAARVVLREVFNAVTLITADGETLAVNMRDSGFECVYQCGDTIIPFALKHGETFPRQEEAMLGYASNRDLITELECRWRLGSTHPDYSTMTSDQFDTDEYTVGDATVLATPARERPHSRACGATKHPHGTACSTNCPTCHGRPL